MKCFVINLARAVERKKYISNQLTELNQEFEFVEGVDWKDIKHSHLSSTAKNLKIKNSFRKLTYGQMGCNLSHRKILKWLINSSEEVITVLEDDVRLSKDFSVILQVLETSPHEYDIVFLGSRFKERQLVDIFPLNDNYNLALSKAREKGAWGYVITKDAARKFLKILPKVTGPIDDALHAYFLHGLKTFTLNPQIVFHEEMGKAFSFNKEHKPERLFFNEEIMRFLSLFIEAYTHKKYYWYRIKSEKYRNLFSQNKLNFFP